MGQGKGLTGEGGVGESGLSVENRGFLGHAGGGFEEGLG